MHKLKSAWSYLKSELRFERDFYFPKGPPETYTNGDEMDPKDARAMKWLSVVSALLAVTIVATVVLVIVV